MTLDYKQHGCSEAHEVIRTIEVVKNSEVLRIEILRAFDDNATLSARYYHRADNGTWGQLPRWQVTASHADDAIDQALVHLHQWKPQGSQPA